MTDAPNRRGGLLADVSVVVLCHDRVDEVRRTIPPRLDDVRQHGLELVVVDNASTDGTREWLAGIHDRERSFALVLSERNVGVGAGRNLGWERTSGRVVITLDEDVHVATAQLAAIAAHLRDDGRAGIVHPIPFHPTTGRPQIAAIPPPYQATNFHGCCYAVRREVIEEVGLHDPLCDFGGEELDLSIRARAAGWEVLQIPDLQVAHNSVTRPGPIATWRRERWTQNHARVLWRAFPVGRALPWSLLMLLAELRAASRRGAPRDVGMLCVAWARGLREGRGARRRVPPDVIRFYASRLGLRATLRRLRERSG